MVLNPRGCNDKYEVEQEIERLNSLRPIRFANSPQGRFLSDIRDSQLNTPSVYADRSPIIITSGQAIGQTSMSIPQVAPDPFAPPPPSIEVYRAEESPPASPPFEIVYPNEEKCKAGNFYWYDGACHSQPKEKPKADFMKSLSDWPFAPIIIGGVVILVFYGLYRAMKK